MIARQTAVQTAIKMKGQRDAVVDVYNNYFKDNGLPYPRGYRVKYSDMLCATYVSCVFISVKTNGKSWTDIVPPECGAPQLYRNMEALGRAVKDKNYVPDIGDLIFFRNSKQSISHVGIVQEVKGTQIYYYDIQSVVARHTCPIGYTYIYGYGLPDYASKVAPEPEPKPEFSVGDLVTVNPGAKWYNGQTIRASVFSDKWYISYIKGDRAVLGMNLAETGNIQSPIHTSDITLVVPNETAPTVEKEAVTVVITKATKELLETLAASQNKTIGEILDSIVGGLR